MRNKTITEYKPDAVTLTDNELQRYSRQLAIPEFGLAGQLKLKHARVAVIGAGGLGTPLLQYLAAAGVGTIGVFDFDRIELSNLHRQVLYGSNDVGLEKATVAAGEVTRRNPACEVKAFNVKLTDENAESYLSQYDVVADATDNFTARYLIDDTTAALGIPLVSAALFRFEGQLSVFNYTHPDGQKGPRYRDLFPKPPTAGTLPNCSESGVLGFVPGVIGSLQAAEVIKVITGMGEILSGKLLLFDLLTMQADIMKFGGEYSARRQSVRTDYQKDLVKKKDLVNKEELAGKKELANQGVQRRGVSESESLMRVPELTYADIRELRKNGDSIHFVDIRSQEERDRFHIGGIHIPSGYIESKRDQLPPVNRVLLYCQSGLRSVEAVRLLRNRYGYSHIYSLRGGINGWLKSEMEMDPV